MKFFNQSETHTLIGEMWGLFYSMGTAEYRDRVWRDTLSENQKFSHTLEIRSSFLNPTGGITDSENFNLSLYEYKANTKDKVSKEAYRDIHIAFEGDYTDEGKAPLGTIKDIAIPAVTEVSYFDSIDNSKTLVAGVQYLLKQRKSLILEIGVDPVLALTSSLRGVQEGIDNVLKLTNHDEELKEVIQDILTSGSIDDYQDLSLVERIEQEVVRHHA